MFTPHSRYPSAHKTRTCPIRTVANVTAICRRRRRRPRVLTRARCRWSPARLHVVCLACGVGTCVALCRVGLAAGCCTVVADADTPLQLFAVDAGRRECAARTFRIKMHTRTHAKNVRACGGLFVQQKRHIRLKLDVCLMCVALSRPLPVRRSADTATSECLSRAVRVG